MLSKILQGNNMITDLLLIAKQLKRIADALEESNKLVKDLGGHHDQ